MDTHEVPAEKLMAYLDGEMPAEEAAAFRQLLDQHPQWREEARRLNRVVKATRRMRVRRPAPEFWDGYWEEIDSRIHRRTGWTVLLAGAVALVALGSYKVLAYADSDVARFGLVTVFVGLAVLFAGVIRGRLLEMPKDRYRRIRR